MSKDGTLGGPIRNHGDPQVVEYYLTCPDLYIADDYP